MYQHHRFHFHFFKFLPHIKQREKTTMTAFCVLFSSLNEASVCTATVSVNLFKHLMCVLCNTGLTTVQIRVTWGQERVSTTRESSSVCTLSTRRPRGLGATGRGYTRCAANEQKDTNTYVSVSDKITGDIKMKMIVRLIISIRVSTVIPSPVWKLRHDVDTCFFYWHLEITAGVKLFCFIRSHFHCSLGYINKSSGPVQLLQTLTSCTMHVFAYGSVVGHLCFTPVCPVSCACWLHFLTNTNVKSKRWSGTNVRRHFMEVPGKNYGIWHW